MQFFIIALVVCVPTIMILALAAHQKRKRDLSGRPSERGVQAANQDSVITGDRQSDPFLLVAGSSEQSVSAIPSSDGVKPAASSGGTPRERRLQDMRDRAKTGLCLYCEQPASHQIPRLKQIRSPLDPIYRRLGVVPMNRYSVDVERSVDFEDVICEEHHIMARSHVEELLADAQREYAKFVVSQRREVYEYMAHGLDEQMLEDANNIRRGKKPKAPKVQEQGTVRTLGLVKNTG